MALSCSSSKYRARLYTKLRITLSGTACSKITYFLYVGFCFKPCLSCSEQKPSLRQRHSLLASNAESRIRLVVLLTAPKIFAIGSCTDKNSYRNFARLSAWWCRLGGTPTPEQKLIRSVLINGMCLFEVSVRKANAEISAELTSHTSPFCKRLQQVAIICLSVFVFLFPHAKNCAFIFLTLAQVRLFLTCGSPCVCSTSDCAVLLRSWRTKRGGITRGRYLSMRVPTVFPASDGLFCRESTLYEWWKKYRRGPERWGNSI